MPDWKKLNKTSTSDWMFIASIIVFALTIGIVAGKILKELCK